MDANHSSEGEELVSTDGVKECDANSMKDLSIDGFTNIELT